MGNDHPHSCIIRTPADVDPLPGQPTKLRVSEQTLSVTHVSELEEVYSATVLPSGLRVPHFGLLLTNTHQFRNETKSLSHTYLLVHAVCHSTDPTKPQLDLYFANERDHALARLAAVSRQTAEHVVCTNRGTTSAKVSGAAVATYFQQFLARQFASDTKVAPQKMALQQYTGMANCVLFAQGFGAFVRGADPEVAIESYIADHRGALLKMAALSDKQTLDTLQGGVPCTNQGFWRDVHTKVVAGSGDYRLQEHKLAEDDAPHAGHLTATVAAVISGTAKVVRAVAPWSIHNCRYRLIVWPAGTRDWEYKWREIGRDNTLATLKTQFDAIKPE